MQIQKRMAVWVLRKSQYLVRIRENTNQKKLRISALVTQWLSIIALTLMQY